MMFDPFKPFIWQLAHGRSITLGNAGVLMGILNVTPDSFSDGGKFDHVGKAVRQAKRMYSDGAAIIDIGGESTRPGADPVSAEIEQQRILPIIEALRGHKDILVSVDTWRAETASRAVSAGAHIINDVWGFQKDPEISQVAKDTGAGCVLMHTGRERTKNPDPVADQLEFLKKSLAVGENAGVQSDRIVLDPGFGFAKDTEENLAVLSNLEVLFELGHHVLTGTSRKRFIGDVSARPLGQRDIATAATTVVARMKGSAIFRVHDVAKNRDALRMADAVLKARGITA